MNWEIVNKRMTFVVGNGMRVKFWRDRLCREEPLRVAFSILFAIATFKEARVEEVWDDSLEEGSWALRFVRAFHD